MADRDMLRGRYSVCRSAGRAIRQPVALGVCRGDAHFWYQLVPLPPTSRGWLLRQLLGLCHLQFGLMLLLLPMQIVIFHGISLTSWLANLVAVPLVTFAIVPLILAAMLLHHLRACAG